MLIILKKLILACLLVLIFFVVYLEGILCLFYIHIVYIVIAKYPWWDNHKEYIWFVLSVLIFIISLLRFKSEQKINNNLKQIGIAGLFVLMFFIIYWQGMYLCQDFIFANVSGHDELFKLEEYIVNTWLFISNLIFFGLLLLLKSKRYGNKISKKMIISCALFIGACIVYWVGIYFFGYPPEDLATKNVWSAHRLKIWSIFSILIFVLPLLTLKSKKYEK